MAFGINSGAALFLWAGSDEFGAQPMATQSIRMAKPGDLKPYPRNPRTHSRKQIRQIANSIERFGFTNPVLIDRAT